jgi:hypothetical protein
MVLLLRIDVLHHGIELTRAHRKRAIPLLPNSAPRLHSEGDVRNTDDLLYRQNADLASPFAKGRG